MINGLCYRSLLWMIPLQLLQIPVQSEYRRWESEREKRWYMEGFQEILSSLVTSLHAGLSLENACRSALHELRLCYEGRTHPALSKMEELCRGLDLNIPVEVLFLRFAEESQVEDIYEFAIVLDIVRKTGGNIIDIIRTTADHLKMKMDTANEMRVILSGILFEKNVMLLMPFFMLGYLNLTGSTYTDCFYYTAAGRVVMSGVILVVTVCYYWSEHIVKIEI